jgi:hypothetical protein
MAESFLSSLAAVQAAVPALKKDKTNPHFRSKYVSLDSIVETVGPLLNEHGLVWITKPSSNEHGPTLDYRLVHVKTGEGESGSMPLLLTKQDSQGFGSAVTYARRYALSSVLNLVTDDDDDGNGNVPSSAPVNRTAAASPPGRNAEGVAPSEKQVKLLEKLIGEKLSRDKHEKTAQLNILLAAVGAEGVTVSPGWTGKLTGGKQGTCSALIDRLMQGAVPDPANRSDVPAPTLGEFMVEQVPAGGDVDLPFDAS